MTRINCIPPSELWQKHLVAEYRELPRIFSCVRDAQAKGLTPKDIGAPSVYVLGVGHMKFFYDKLIFLMRRQGLLIDEMLKRGYDPQFRDYQLLGVGLKSHWMGDWEPTLEAIALNRSRIDERYKEGVRYDEASVRVGSESVPRRIRPGSDGRGY